MGAPWSTQLRNSSSTKQSSDLRSVISGSRDWRRNSSGNCRPLCGELNTAGAVQPAGAMISKGSEGDLTGLLFRSSVAVGSTIPEPSRPVQRNGKSFIRRLPAPY